MTGAVAPVGGAFQHSRFSATFTSGRLFRRLLGPGAQFLPVPGASWTPPSQLQEAGVLPRPPPTRINPRRGGFTAARLSLSTLPGERRHSSEILHINKDYDLHKERRPRWLSTNVKPPESFFKAN